MIFSETSGELVIKFESVDSLEEKRFVLNRFRDILLTMNLLEVKNGKN